MIDFRSESSSDSRKAGECEQIYPEQARQAQLTQAFNPPKISTEIKQPKNPGHEGWASEFCFGLFRAVLGPKGTAK